MDIDSLGRKLVSCEEKCEGIRKDYEKGILPRCLFFEKRNGKGDAIVVGLNPGSGENKKGKKEREFYRKYKRGNLYDAVKKYSLNLIRNHLYYCRIRKVLDLLSFKGDIIWTELVKCESSDKKKGIPMQTFKVCINKYLKQEIEEFPKYTIFAVGGRTFEYCSLSFPNHFIIGIPHPTGAYGNPIGKLIENIQEDSDKYKKILEEKKHFNTVIRLE